MDSEIWINELDDKRHELENLAVKFCDKIKDIYEYEKVKVIVTYRIKGRASLAEKIKRHNFDNEGNIGKSIFDLLNDAIGIRIICMKINDEKHVYDIITKSIGKLSDELIEFNENLYIQPTSQKNGHSIYKFDGFIKTSERKFPFEMQIKSLANLFWGEMEHLLFYKNSKVLISNKYYEKEINSIYDELKNIDNKLTYMEDAMMSENEENLLQEKIEVFKRYAYIQLREPLRKEFGDHLNNKYIFDAVGDYLFITYRSFKDEEGRVLERDTDDILRKAMDILLDKNRNDINLSLFIFDPIEDTRLHNDIKYLLNDIFSERKNGWWIYIILCSIYAFFYENVGNNMPMEISSIKSHVDKCIKNLCDVVHKEINLYTKLNEQDYQNDKEEMQSLTLELAKRFLQHCRDKKNLKFTEKKYANNYNSYGLKLIKGLDAMNLSILENFHNDSNFIECIHSILIVY